MKPQIIFSDIDGTLITSDYQVMPRTKAALQKAISEGVRFVPVSARMPEAIKTVTDVIDPHCPLICYNGALILDEQQRIIASYPLDRDIAKDICQLVETRFHDIAWNVYGHHDWLGQSHDRHRVEREERIVQVLSTPATIADIENMKDVHKVLLMGEPEEVDEAETMLKEVYPQLSIARSSAILLEIMNRGIRKGAAIRDLCDYYHISVEKAISFGDHFNDLDMLKTTGLSYVMGNAPEEMKKAIPHVTADHNHEGIAIVLHDLFDNE